MATRQIPARFLNNAGGGSNRIIYTANYAASNSFTLAETPTRIYEVRVYNTTTPLSNPVAAYTWTPGTNVVTVTDTLASGDIVYFDVELAVTNSGNVYATKVQITSVASSTTIVSTVETLFKCDASSGAIVITLISAVGNSGLKLHFKKTESSSNSITLDGSGSETIDGGLTAVFARQNTSLTIVSDGANWHIISG